MTKTSEEIKAVVIGPGAGEYVYSLDPKECPGGISRIKTTVDKLVVDYPNLEKVSLVVGWFGDTLNAGKIHISPKAETRNGIDWKVGSVTRKTAELLNKKSAWSNGTPDDKNIVELTKYLSEKGLKVTLYPMLFIDDAAASWRGFISAKTSLDVKHFFKEYNKFIEHYASLLKGQVETLIIGSEMEALTKFKDKDGNFPAVDELINLAKTVRELVGDDVKLTYAANWSEYHHSDGGWYHLDKLWADPNINYVGIDAYFPVTDEPLHGPVDPKIIADGWTKGRDFDYYVDGNKKVPMDSKWGAKNFVGWWNSKHFNPNGKQSDWQPKMKQIVFTEVGFTALDASTNEPYKYFPALPEHSNGHVDPLIQYNAIAGTILFYNSLKENPDTAEALGDIFWYNIFPTGYGDDYAHNHELKVAMVESSSIYPGGIGIA